MKQKLTIVLYIILSLMILTINSTQGLTAAANTASEPNVIPDEAIRLRILANSNNDADQQLKREIRNRVNYQITNWVGEITSVDQARAVIASNLVEIENIVKETLTDFGIEQTFTVKFKEVSFPTKMYGSFIYPAGTYEAVLITLGDGGGANWWCVLFPPLCFLDFSNGDAVKADPAETAQGGDVEVKFFVVELFTKISGFIKSII